MPLLCGLPPTVGVVPARLLACVLGICCPKMMGLACYSFRDPRLTSMGRGIMRIFRLRERLQRVAGSTWMGLVWAIQSSPNLNVGEKLARLIPQPYHAFSRNVRAAAKCRRIAHAWAVFRMLLSLDATFHPLWWQGAGHHQRCPHVMAVA